MLKAGCSELFGMQKRLCPLFALFLLYRPRASDTQSTTTAICSPVSMKSLSLQSRVWISINLFKLPTTWNCTFWFYLTLEIVIGTLNISLKPLLHTHTHTQSPTYQQWMSPGILKKYGIKPSGLLFVSSWANVISFIKYETQFFFNMMNNAVV